MDCSVLIKRSLWMSSASTWVRLRPFSGSLWAVVEEGMDEGKVARINHSKMGVQNRGKDGLTESRWSFC